MTLYDLEKIVWSLVKFPLFLSVLLIIIWVKASVWMRYTIADIQISYQNSVTNDSQALKDYVSKNLTFISELGMG